MSSLKICKILRKFWKLKLPCWNTEAEILRLKIHFLNKKCIFLVTYSIFVAKKEKTKLDKNLVFLFLTR